MAVLRGAVLYGLDPAIVHVRRATKTYGIGIIKPFNWKSHPKGQFALCLKICETYFHSKYVSSLKIQTIPWIIFHFKRNWWLRTAASGASTCWTSSWWPGSRSTWARSPSGGTARSARDTTTSCSESTLRIRRTLRSFYKLYWG